MPSPIISMTFLTFLPCGGVIFSTSYGFSQMYVCGLSFCAAAGLNVRTSALTSRILLIFIADKFVVRLFQCSRVASDGRMRVSCTLGMTHTKLRIFLFTRMVRLRINMISAIKNVKNTAAVTSPPVFRRECPVCRGRQSISSSAS